MSGVFISYRRSDIGSYAAGRLYDALARRFGRKHVFMDIDSLRDKAGLDFGHALDQAITECDVLLALIGPEWVSAVDANGNRRLDDPTDLLRLEVARALARNDIRVIPVLMGGASSPRAEELPEDLKPLARRQKFEISESRWDYDVGQLIETVLEPIVDRLPWQPNRRVFVASMFAVATGGAAFAVWALDDDRDSSDPTPDAVTPEVTETETERATETVTATATVSSFSPPDESVSGTLAYTQDFIPVGSGNLADESMLPTYITVHETGNTNADAEAQRNWIFSADAAQRQASFHWIVDDAQAIQLLPHREVAWHTGDQAGNTTSIGVSACIFADEARQTHTRHNLAELLAKLIRENDNADFSLERVVPHSHWANKDCPHTIRADNYWNTLIENVRQRL